MNGNLIKGVGLLCFSGAFSIAQASIIMEGDYVRTAISDNGTLGYGGNTSPGLLHDPSGTSTFGSSDYLTPGTPWEYFGVSSTESGSVGNNNTNSGGVISSSTLTDISGSSVYDNAVQWVGSYSTFFDITTTTYFNDEDEFVSFVTTITALSDLTNLSFLRAIDPDMPTGASTTNSRGYGSLAASDWVNSINDSNGLTLGLYSVSDVTHNTGVTNWTTNHSDYLSGTNLGNGDYTIGVAFDIGTLLTGESVTFDYHYVMGDTPDSVDIPDVPEPVGLVYVAAAFLGWFGVKRSKS